MEPQEELRANSKTENGQQSESGAAPGTGDSEHVTSNEISPPHRLPFPVVGVGASAGGLEAFTQLLRALPPHTGMAYVLVQHLDPHHESQLQELLTPATEMPVVVAQDSMPVERNTVYVIPPNKDLLLAECKLHLVPRKPGLHLPVDTFFESLAAAQGGRAIAIVLSGNAADGSRGVRAVKSECGITFAQDEESARHTGMPRSAVATGAVDFVMAPAEIARQLAVLSRHPYVTPPQKPEQGEEILPEGDGELKRVFALLQSATKVDFSRYKENTIRRRIGRRMIVQQKPSLTAYARYLEKHPAEIRKLYHDLLISVTNFFRDPPAFHALAAQLDGVLSSWQSQEPFRVWVAGCASGEEVYSLAIMLLEIQERLGTSVAFQLFGTDISDAALERARSGVYPEGIAQDVSPERLKRFFGRVDGSYRIVKTIRDTCVFARQDLARDPPFGHTDLISCRNVLIYMDSVLQKRVLPIFHYSLKANGLLFLGSSETTATSNDLFAPVDAQHRIYGRKPGVSRFSFEVYGPKGPMDAEDQARARTQLSGADLQQKTDRIIQSKYAPAAVLVDSEFQILQFRGHTSFYLDPSPGEATLNLLRMAREGLVLPVRRGIEAAARKGVSHREEGIHLQHGDELRTINLDVTPITGSRPSERYFLLVFEEKDARADSDSEQQPFPAAGDGPAYPPAAETQIRSLGQELAETREYLRNLKEDHEASTEELSAANEEIRSSNEELQSTNEELSTTKEELQSANEELTTVNEELQHRNQELDAVNSDLNNSLAAVNIPILMVDKGLRLRRFNTATETLMNFTAADMGRRVAHLAGPLVIPNLEDIVQNVLETLTAAQREIQDESGRWYSLSVRPYRTLDNRIDGAVLTFVDVDLLKRSLKSAEQSRDYADAMIETVREPLVVLDADLRVRRATESFYETFMVSREETLGRFIYDLGNGQWNIHRLRELLGNALFHDARFHDFEVDLEFPHLGRRAMRLNARRIPRQDHEPRALLLAIEDVTKRREEAEQRYRRLFETAKDAVLMLDAETETVRDVNPHLITLTGYPREEFVGRKLFDTKPFAAASLRRSFLAEVAQMEVVRQDGVALETRAGRNVYIDVLANRYLDGSRPVIQANIRDVTDRIQADEALGQSEERFRLFVESVKDYALFQTDVNGNVTAWNSGAERLLGYSEREIVGRSAAVIFTPEDRAHGVVVTEMNTARKTGRAEDERWHMRKDGSRFFASGVLTAVRDEAGGLCGFAKIMRDVTEHKQAEEQIRTALRDKEVLLKEIHHRIKNNLQMIASLLGLQAGYLRDPADSKALAVIEEMENRIRSIAGIHEMLYGSPDLARIEFAAYAEKMSKDLFAFYSVSPDRIHLETDLHKESLTIGQAVPCGLILNELITNCLKHAYPQGRTGTIRVLFTCLEEECTLAVSDDGIGLTDGVEPQSATSMGLQLVRLIVEQLQGTMSVTTDGGTHLMVSFQKKV